MAGINNLFCSKMICKNKNLMTITIVGLELILCRPQRIQTLWPEVQLSGLYFSPYKWLYFQPHWEVCLKILWVGGLGWLWGLWLKVLPGAPWRHVTEKDKGSISASLHCFFGYLGIKVQWDRENFNGLTPLSGSTLREGRTASILDCGSWGPN